MESMCCTAALIIHSLLVHEAQLFFTSSSLSLLWAEDNVVQNLFGVLVCFGYL
jgi:hypothetical protein